MKSYSTLSDATKTTLTKMYETLLGIRGSFEKRMNGRMAKTRRRKNRRNRTRRR